MLPVGAIAGSPAMLPRGTKLLMRHQRHLRTAPDGVVCARLERRARTSPVGGALFAELRNLDNLLISWDEFKFRSKFRKFRTAELRFRLSI